MHILRCRLVLVIAITLATVVECAAVREAIAQATAGEIVGEVVSEDGGPVRGALVILVAARIGFSRNSRVDTKGRFRFDDVPQGPYELRVSAPGYYQPGAGSIVKSGESARLVLAKGAVVSGKVVDDKGKPLVDIAVRLAFVNRPQVNQVETPFGTTRTDDRGIYRIFGLRPGTYVISAGGNTRVGSDPRGDAYQHEVASYHPTGGRENASEVVVRAGDELLDIDIVHRGQVGRRVSGRVTGFVGSVFPSVTLLNVATRVQSFPNGPIRTDDGQFNFDSVPDGEYELFARLSTPTTGGSSTTAAFASLRIPVKGNDITGLNLNLVPLGTISGSIEVGTTSSAPSCKSTEALLPGQVRLMVVPSEWTRQQLPVPLVPSPERVTADEKWQFRIGSVPAGSYRPFVFLASSGWYVDYITTAVRQAAGTRRVSDAMDFTLKGIQVSVGGNVSGLRVGIAHGGAEIQGRVNSREPLPTNSMRVYAVPTEEVANPLRYYEAFVGNNGVFRISGIKPGVYRLIAQRTRDTDSEGQALPVSLMSGADRAQIRMQAEKVQKTVELQACQRVEGVVVEY